MYVNRINIGAVAGVTLLAAGLRFVSLTGAPPGLHGDEAATGLRASYILANGWIGPFDPIHGLGQPAGMEYWTAGVVSLLGNDITTIRLAMAIVGAATVPLAYALFFVVANRRVAWIGAALLAVMGWHLHFSRLALPPISWPFFTVATVLFLVLGLKTQRKAMFCVAGVVMGLGAYSYSSFAFTVVGIALFLGLWMVTNWRDVTARHLIGVGMMALLALIVAMPMIWYVAEHYGTYSSYPRAISIFSSDEYTSATSPLDHASVVLNATRDFLGRLLADSDPDASDGSGGVPLLNPVMAVLFLAGLVIAIWRWRTPASLLALAMLVVIPWAGILTVGGGIARRTVGLTPFLVLLAAMPLAEVLRIAELRRPAVRVAGGVAVAVILITAGTIDARWYFNEFPDSPTAYHTFGPELVASAEFMNQLDGEQFVLFYSGRWSINFETIRFLAPNVRGEDRSHEFGTFSLQPPLDGNVVYVFLVPYLDALEEVERSFPGGERHYRSDERGRPLFAAYALQDPIPVDLPPNFYVFDQ